jgi:adenylate cyclase
MSDGGPRPRTRWLRAVARAALIAFPFLLLLPAILQDSPSGLAGRVENYLYDLRVRFAMPGGVDRRIVIVDIDESSLAREGQWPWSRTRLAALMDALFDEYGARVVAFDVQFPEAERASALSLFDELAPAAARDKDLAKQLGEMRTRYEADARFAESFIARDVVLGFSFKRALHEGQPRESGVLPSALALGGEKLDAIRWLEADGFAGNLAELQANASGGGFFDTPLTDEDGVVRRLPLLQRYNGGIYESLDLATARLAAGGKPIEFGFARRRGAQQLEFIQVGDKKIPVDERGTILAPFRGHVSSFPYIAATRVLHGEAPSETLKNAIVLIGATASGLNDIRPTPVDREYFGVEAHANAIAGILDGTILARPWWTRGFTLGTLLVLVAYFAFVVPRLSVIPAITGAASLGVLILAINMSAWMRSGIVLPLAAPLFYLIVTSVLLLSYGYYVESRRKRHLSRIFSQYVPPEIVQELDASEADISLEGDSRDMSVLFSDVRGFTTLSEGLSPRELTRLMNDMLTPLTAAIHERRGTIDKYMGDAIMAFWGAPLTDPAHARNAVLAALDMIACTARIREEFAARGWPPVHIGVGVSTGPMNVGNMGSKFRMAYTVLGDTVNLGSRLEGLTKQYGADVIVSGVTMQAIPDMHFRELDAVRVKGKNEPVKIYEPLGLRTVVDSARVARMEQFHEALEHYRARQFGAALSLLDDLARDRDEGLVALYRERVTHFLADPPPQEWDGVFVHKTK